MDGCGDSKRKALVDVLAMHLGIIFAGDRRDHPCCGKRSRVGIFFIELNELEVERKLSIHLCISEA